MKAILAIVLVHICAELTLCFQVIPERSNMTYFNPKYLFWARMRVQRYARRAPYYFHLEGSTKHTWANNITVHIIYKEFLHNEFRRTFIETHLQLCELINEEPYVGVTLRAGGAVCPAPAGEYHMMNMTVSTQRFPNVWPFEKGRVDIELALTATGETIATFYMVATFKVVDKKINVTLIS